MTAHDLVTDTGRAYRAADSICIQKADIQRALVLDDRGAIIVVKAQHIDASGMLTARAYSVARNRPQGRLQGFTLEYSPTSIAIMVEIIYRPSTSYSAIENHSNDSCCTAEAAVLRWPRLGGERRIGRAPPNSATV
jgi:hypothetical protein